MPNGAKNWVWTLNNYTQNEEDLLQALAQDPKHGILYMVYGREVGESGTPHLQGYISFSKRRPLNQLRQLVGQRAHYEIAKGSPVQASVYCQKDGNFWEHGERPKGKGSRTDLLDMRDAIKNGATKEFILDNHFGAYSRATRAATNAFLIYGKGRDWVTNVHVHWGATGTGKTRKAIADSTSEPYIHPGGMWFDGYDRHEFVIFDDFGGSEFKLTYLLKLLDRYPMRVPVKGGFVQFVPKTIFITSNKDAKEWYPNVSPEHQAALIRRITSKTHFIQPFNFN